MLKFSQGSVTVPPADEVQPRLGKHQEVGAYNQEI